MPDEVLQLKGLEDVQKSIFRFGKKFGVKIVRDSLRRGANLIARQARKNAPKGKTGNLRRAVMVRNSKIYKGQNSQVGVYVTLKTRFKKGSSKDAFYGRFIHDGWEVKGVRKRGPGSRQTITEKFGRRPGRKTQPSGHKIPGNRFIEDAYRQQRTQATRLAVEALKRAAAVVARQSGLK